MKKEVLLIVAMMLIFTFNIITFATENNGISVDGNYFQNLYKDLETNKTYNLFLLQNKYSLKNNIKTYNVYLPILNNKIELLSIRNQYAYLPAINNNSDPYNLNPLKNPANTKMLELDGTVKDFKTQSYDSSLPYPFISYENLHFKNSKGSFGLYRFVFDRFATQVSTLGFYPDKINKNTTFENRDLYNKPQSLNKGNYYIKETETNKLFEKIMADYAKYGLTDDVKNKLVPYARNYLIAYAYKTQTISSNIMFEMFDKASVTKTDSNGNTIPGYPKLLAPHRVSPFTSVNALIEQMKRYYAVQTYSELASFGISGRSAMAHKYDKEDFYVAMSIGSLDGSRDLLIHNYDIFRNQVIEDYVRLLDKASNQELPYKWITKKLNGTFEYKFKEYIISDKTRPLKLEYDVRFLYAQGYSSNYDNDAITSTLNTMIFTDAFIKSTTNAGTTVLKDYKYNVPTSAKGNTEKLKSYVSHPLDDFVFQILSGVYDGTKIMDEVQTYYDNEKATYSIDVDPSILTETSYAEISLSESLKSYNVLSEANSNGTPYSPVSVSLTAFSDANRNKISSLLGKFGNKYLEGSNALIFNDNEPQIYNNDKTYVYFKFEDTIAQDLKISVDSIDGKIEPNSEITVKGKIYNKSEDRTKVDKIKVNFSLNTNNGNELDKVRNSITTENVLIKSPKILKGYNAETKTYDFWNFEYKIKIPASVKANDLLYLATTIPSEYDGNANIYYREDDYIEKELVVNQTFSTSKLNDMSIDVFLIDSSSAKIYNTKNQQGTYAIEPDKAYSIVVEMKKVKGSEIVNNPSFILSYKTSSNSPYSTYYLAMSGNIRVVGDKVQYKLPVNIPSQFLDVRAEINPVYLSPRMDGVILDDNKENNIVSKIYANILDIELSKINLSQTKHHISNNNNTPIAITISGVVTLNSMTVNQVNNVKIDLYKNDIFIASRYQTLYKGIENIVVFNQPSMTYAVGNTAFEMRVNPDRAYKEFNGNSDPYSNNQKRIALSVYNNDTSVESTLYCRGGAEHTTNFWKITYNLWDGGKYSEHTYPVLDSNGKVLDYKTVKYCNAPSPTYKGKEDRDHSENLGLIAEIANDKTGWQWQPLSSTNNTINAGKGFKIRFKATYSTNRASYPSININECGSDVSPIARNITSITNLQISTNYNFASIPANKFFSSNSGVYTTNSTTGGLSNFSYVAEIKQTRDKVGNTTNILYTETTDRNQSITFQVFTNDFEGHGKRWDNQTTHKNLIGCKTFTIYIKDPVSIIDQEIKK